MVIHEVCPLRVHWKLALAADVDVAVDACYIGVVVCKDARVRSDKQLISADPNWWAALSLLGQFIIVSKVEHRSRSILG